MVETCTARPQQSCGMKHCSAWCCHPWNSRQGTPHRQGHAWDERQKKLTDEHPAKKNTIPEEPPQMSKYFCFMALRPTSLRHGFC